MKLGLSNRVWAWFLNRGGLLKRAKVCYDCFWDMTKWSKTGGHLIQVVTRTGFTVEYAATIMNGYYWFIRVKVQFP